MDSFVMGGDLWHVIFISPNDVNLIDRTGRYTVATTDPVTQTVYLSEELSGDFLVRVLIHELGHCALLSFNLLDEIHKVVLPMYWIEAEEWICNLLADYGRVIFSTSYRLLGNEAWRLIPQQFERLIA